MSSTTPLFSNRNGAHGARVSTSLSIQPFSKLVRRRHIYNKTRLAYKCEETSTIIDAYFDFDTSIILDPLDASEPASPNSDSYIKIHRTSVASTIESDSFYTTSTSLSFDQLEVASLSPAVSYISPICLWEDTDVEQEEKPFEDKPPATCFDLGTDSLFWKSICKGLEKSVSWTRPLSTGSPREAANQLHHEDIATHAPSNIKRYLPSQPPSRLLSVPSQSRILLF
ncbi:hypothetical protein ABKN59_006056 [Abortiporus biennis]